MALPAIIAGAMRSLALAEAGGAGGAGAGGAGARFAAGGAAPGMGLNLFQAQTQRITVQSQVFNQTEQKVKSLGERFREINQTLAYVNYNVHAFTQTIASIPNRFVQSFTFAVDTLAHAAQPFVSLVSRNNPAVTKQWELALNDAYGVLGRMMIPVVQSFTRVARTLGDTMAGLEPVMRPAIAAVAQFVEVSGKQFTDAIKSNAELFDTLGMALAFTAHEATSTVRVFGTIAKLFGAINGFGLGSNFNPSATSMGAGIRTSRQIGQPEELQNELIKNALMAGAGGSNEERQTNYLEKISTNIDELWKTLRPWLTGVGFKPGQYANFLADDMQKSKLGRIPGLNEIAGLYAMFRTS